MTNRIKYLSPILLFATLFSACTLSLSSDTISPASGIPQPAQATEVEVPYRVDNTEFHMEITNAPMLDARNLEPYRWQNRLLLIFAESSASKPYLEQLGKYATLSSDLFDRDMLWFHIYQTRPNSASQTEQNENHGEQLYPSYLEEGHQPIAQLSGELIQWLQDRYNPDNAAFRVILIGKDGGVKLNSIDVIEPEQLFSLIDAMPMRQQEMRQEEQ